jgi:anti-sigma B factor antagonist
MSVKLNTRQVGDVTVVDVSGSITLGEGSSVIRDEMHTLTGKGNKKVLLNLGDVTYIDSSGIGELVAGYTTMANALQHGRLRDADCNYQRGGRSLSGMRLLELS